MTVKIDLLRETIAYLRKNLDKYDQEEVYYNGKGCVIGMTAALGGAKFDRWNEYIELFPNGSQNYLDYATDDPGLGLDREDADYILDCDRTLDEIEARVNEIAARENPPVVSDDNRNWERVTLKIKDNTYIVSPGEVEAIVMGARAVDPNVRIVKVTEEVL